MGRGGNSSGQLADFPAILDSPAMKSTSKGSPAKDSNNPLLPRVALNGAFLATRQEVIDKLKTAGYVACSSVSEGTKFLLLGYKSYSVEKIRKAAARGIPVLREEDLNDFFGDSLKEPLPSALEVAAALDIEVGGLPPQWVALEEYLTTRKLQALILPGRRQHLLGQPLSDQQQMLVDKALEFAKLMSSCAPIPAALGQWMLATNPALIQHSTTHVGSPSNQRFFSPLNIFIWSKGDKDTIAKLKEVADDDLFYGSTKRIAREIDYLVSLDKADLVKSMSNFLAKEQNTKPKALDQAFRDWSVVVPKDNVESYAAVVGIYKRLLPINKSVYYDYHRIPSYAHSPAPIWNFASDFQNS